MLLVHSSKTSILPFFWPFGHWAELRKFNGSCW